MKQKILIVFGGVSSEHDVSLVSANSVIKNIYSDKYDIIMMGITKQGESFVFTGDPDLLPDDKWLSDEKNLKRAIISPDRLHHGVVYPLTGETERVDCVFPVLHGKNGEDGTIQGLLEIAGIPFVGCDHASSAVCMDKTLTNAMTDYFGFDQAKWLGTNRFDYFADPESFLDAAQKKLGYPIFVKPASAGSSVGVSKAKNREELKAACENAFKFDTKLVCEQTITGREVECAVLGNENPIAAIPGEIEPCNDFYDFDAKYVNAASKLRIPAGISEENLEKVRLKATQIYRAMGCSGLSRVDFFVNEDEDKIYLNEINTIPGFTSISMYPKMFAAYGVNYGDLIDRLICCALERESE